MRRVVCFGEALIDFLNTGEATEDGLDLSVFTQYPGGAPANAAVATSRLGGQSVFAGQVGDDAFGHALIAALERYAVNTRFVSVHPTAKTPLAFVVLDHSGDRSFSFYRDNTADLMMREDQVRRAWFDQPSIVHFCSNTLTHDGVTALTQRVVTRARASGAPVSFDVNLRASLWPHSAIDVERVNDMVRRSDIVKFSREEFELLNGDSATTYLESCFEAGVRVVVVTDGPNPIELHVPSSDHTVAAPAVRVVNTTGAGDAFIGAVLFGLARQPDVMSFLADAPALTQLLSFAAHCGAYSVERHGAFPSFPAFEDVTAYWTLSP